MSRYPAEKLESKLVWMRERQRKRQAKEALAAPAARIEPPAPQRELPQMLRARQVAKSLGVSDTTVYRWFRDRAGVVLIQGPRKATMP